MVEVTINGTAVQAEEGATILQAAAGAGITIPTLCYFDGLNDIGACRVCVVEVDGTDRLQAACNTVIQPGMVIQTDTEKVQAARKTALQLLLSQHDLQCEICPRKGTCRFQALLFEYSLITWDMEQNKLVPTDSIFGKDLKAGKRAEWPECAIVQRKTNLCVNCGRCVAACRKLEGLGVWDYNGTGVNATIGVRNGLTMREAGCTACGQCITHCPTGALRERDDAQRLLDAIADPEVTTVVQIAPATRTSWGVSLGAGDGELSVERMVAALKELGVDYVFDTSFSADLTIMEEANELLTFLAERQPDENGILWPMFTSCCPAWVLHAKDAHHDAVPNLSTAKSPMMMFGAVTKTWWADKNDVAPEKIFSLAMMPCTAKKHEVLLPMQANPGIQDMDGTMTTRELARMIQNAGIDVNALEDVPLDDPLGSYTGAGVIFGTTGGVMEAALRSGYYFVTGELPPDPEAFEFTPAGEGRPWVEASFDLNGTVVRCAVASGLANANALLDAIRSGEVAYEFVEIMACPSGCAGGGGQPIDGSDKELGLDRGQTLRKIDRTVTPLRYSHENPVIKVVYDEFFGEPNSHKAHELLHVEHEPNA